MTRLSGTSIPASLMIAWVSFQSSLKPPMFLYRWTVPGSTSRPVKWAAVSSITRLNDLETSTSTPSMSKKIALGFMYHLPYDFALKAGS